jgi:hypothetical protein
VLGTDANDDSLRSSRRIVQHRTQRSVESCRSMRRAASTRSHRHAAAGKDRNDDRESERDSSMQSFHRMISLESRTAPITIASRKIGAG